MADKVNLILYDRARGCHACLPVLAGIIAKMYNIFTQHNISTFARWLPPAGFYIYDSRAICSLKNAVIARCE